jgi:CheY-like chemotaxis protein
VTVATAAAQALQRIVGGERFDVIISDIMMPGMTGAELYAEVLRLVPEQAERMIFITGGATTTETRGFVSRMASRVVGKPIEGETLARRIQERLEQ